MANNSIPLRNRDKGIFMANAQQNDQAAEAQAKAAAAAAEAEQQNVSTSAEDRTPDSAAKRAAADKKAAENRRKEIDDLDIPEDEKQVLKAYDRGDHIYKIAQDVYKFANGDTVGKVLMIIRKEHANDEMEIENVKATRGYTGIGN